MRTGNSGDDLFQYKLKETDKRMEFTSAEKDTGVVTVSTFENHINKNINKENSIMGVIRRI